MENYLKCEQICSQKSVATKILNTLVLIDPKSILAGGAVRDWRIGNPANDLDFYLRMPNHSKQQDVIDTLSQIGFLSVKQLSPKTGGYKELPNLKWVFLGEMDTVLCNIVVLSENCLSPIHTVVENFSNSLCECWIDRLGICCYSDSFETSLRKKEVVLNRGYTKNHPHIKKIMSKFPQYIVKRKD